MSLSFCQVCTAAILNGIVWLALPQGNDHYGVKVFWLILTSSYFISLWRDSCPADIWPSFFIVILRYVIRLGGSLLRAPYLVACLSIWSGYHCPRVMERLLPPPTTPWQDSCLLSCFCINPSTSLWMISNLYTFIIARTVKFF